VTPDGTVLTTPLPDGIDSLFGPELQRFIILPPLGTTDPARRFTSAGRTR
jgi:hypothetical protein